LILWILQQ